jgi:tryptophanyl-tRNA synthetase
MTRVFSGVQPSGSLHIGNYLGAVRQWVADQDLHDSMFCIVDLHTLTLPHDPSALRQKTFETAVGLLASGLDPDRCILFVQGHVPAHTELTWLLECTATFGELSRMTQFKEKSEGQASVSGGLFTYPVLMASDILLYGTDLVPVGDDQRQHIELTRDVAIRFNNRYGDVFTIPEAEVPVAGARIMDFQHPGRKMSKSIDSPLGTIGILDEPEDITRKIKRAVTDSDGVVTFDPDAKPGLANLLETFGALTRRAPKEIAADYDRYGPLKEDLAEALIEELRPVRAKYAELSAEPGSIHNLLATGAGKAADLAAPMLARARHAVGLLDR